MPVYCVLNNLIVHDVPDVIASLNTFEKVLIQRAKAFQTVVKIGTVINKKLPQTQMIQKVKGKSNRNFSFTTSFARNMEQIM